MGTPTVTVTRLPPRPVLPPAPAPATPRYFTPATPAFTQLTNDTLGDAGTSADGWDPAVAAYADAVAATDQGAAQAQALNDALDGPTGDLLELGDELSDLITAAQVLSDAAEAEVFNSIGALAALAPALPSLAIDALPGLAAIAAPTVIDLTTEITALLEAALPDIESTVEAEMESWLNSLLNGGVIVLQGGILY